jgi:hypothetical protein
VHREWSAQSNGVGLAAAVAGALACAWLGFHATAGLTALVTAILGAVAGANLVLIVIDIARTISADDRIPPTLLQTAVGERQAGDTHQRWDALTGAHDHSSRTDQPVQPGMYWKP